MKTTAFNQLHKEAGGKMVPFAGFEMPVEFAGIKTEHMQVRNSVGVFDVSHMGEFWVKGDRAFELVQYITTNDISSLEIGQAQYSCLPNGRGGIVDDLIVYYYQENKYLLVVNASNIEKDWAWIVSQNKMGAELENASDSISQLAIQGPKATEVLQKLTPIDLASIKYYHFTTGELAGVKDVIISATGYTGSGGFELYFDNSAAEKIYHAIFEAGAEFDIQPIGLGARDTLRLEKGYCLYGNDIDDTTSPMEAGLAWITKFNDENTFIDKARFEAEKKEGVEQKLRGFEMIDRGIPRNGYEIFDKDDNVIGRVTSGTQSPCLSKGIGLGYILSEYAAFGTEVFIGVRNKKLKAQLVKLPFVK